MLKIGEKIIGGDSTFIIADIGSNHMQDLTLAKKTILAAANAGVDAVKFQSIQLNRLYHKPDNNTKEFIKKLEFPEFWHKELNDYCKSLQIPFFSSPTYLEAIDILEEIDVPLYKIASAQIGVFPQLVDRVASLNKPTIFSTGIINNEELDLIVNTFNKYNNSKFIILHCNSIYPTPVKKVNLPMIQYYKKKYPNQPIGFSDHTIGTHIVKAAVAMGATVIEKHFTLDKNFESPDSNAFACDPEQMKSLCKEIREIDLAKKSISNRSTIQNEEHDFKKSIKTLIFTRREILKGESITEKDIYFYRSSQEGIDCNFLYEKKKLIALKNIDKGVVIKKQWIN